MSNTSRTICVVGPFPPPVHGQAVATEYVCAALETTGRPVARFDTGGNPSAKMSAFVRAAIWLLIRPRTAAYISVHARKGMVLTALLARIARIRGHRLFLHHHTRSHLYPGAPNMDRLARWAGPDATHITICPTMSKMAQQASDAVCNVASLSNVGVVDLPDDLADEKINRQFTPKVLGHMSNLTVDKGVGRAIAAFAAAKSTGQIDRLILAGPAATPEAQAIVSDAQDRFGADIEWRGPVHGPEKERFFSDTDVFLFPSLYPDETQGIVNLEALASGTPVLAYGLCCINDDLNGVAASHVPADADFTVALDTFLTGLPNDAPRLARARYDELRAKNTEELETLLKAICG